jgi:hypothetical protein
VLWNQVVHTQRGVTANRPEIIIKNKKEKTCALIDVATPADRNILNVACGQVEVSLTGRSLVKGSPTVCACVTVFGCNINSATPTVSR